MDGKQKEKEDKKFKSVLLQKCYGENKNMRGEHMFNHLGNPLDLLNH